MKKESNKPENRFWRKVVKSDLCWSWAGRKNKAGYGILMVNTKNVTAHRFSFSLHFGEIPEGYMVCHRCDNPECTRPDHLFKGTALDNNRDSFYKGRRGKSHGSSVFVKGHKLPAHNKMPEDKVNEIIKSVLSGMSHHRVAYEFGVVRSTVSRIIKKHASL